jgi:hypothetical protein
MGNEYLHALYLHRRSGFKRMPEATVAVPTNPYRFAAPKEIGKDVIVGKTSDWSAGIGTNCPGLLHGNRGKSLDTIGRFHPFRIQPLLLDPAAGD